MTRALAFFFAVVVLILLLTIDRATEAGHAVGLPAHMVGR